MLPAGTVTVDWYSVGRECGIGGVYVVSLTRSPVHVRSKHVPRGNRQRVVPLYSVKSSRTSARSVALDPECVKEQLNEPRYRFQIRRLDITTPIIRYGNVQRSAIFVDALQRPSDRKCRYGVLFSCRCSNIIKLQTEQRHAGNLTILE